MKPGIKERIDAIKELYLPGMSAAQIASALNLRGFDVSRAAVIGMYNRHRPMLADYPLATLDERADATTARIDTIKRVYRPGMTMQDIADELYRAEGRPVSRSVVSGLYNRYPVELKDCPLGPLGMRPRAYPTKERPAHHKRQYTRRVVNIPNPSNVVPFVLPETAFTYVATHPTKMLLDLKANECRWPMNGSGAAMQFCAQHADRSYCEHHRLMSIGQGTRGEQEALKTLRKLA